MSNKVPRPPLVPKPRLIRLTRAELLAQINDDIEDAEFASWDDPKEEEMIKLTHTPVWTSADGKWAVVEATEQNRIPRHALRTMSFKDRDKAIAIDPGDYDRGVQKRGGLTSGFTKVPTACLPELLTNEFGDISL